MLITGANAVGLVLGNGMDNVPDGKGRYTNFTPRSSPKANYQSINGLISNHWALNGDQMTMDVTLPAGLSSRFGCRC